MIRFCPFAACSAALSMAGERAAPGPQPQVVVRYPEHRLNGLAGEPLCPASLMAFPLDLDSVAHLVRAADELARQLEDRAAGQVDERPRVAKQPRGGESEWFRWSGGGPTGRGDGYVAPPVMEQVLMPIDDQEEQR